MSLVSLFYWTRCACRHIVHYTQIWRHQETGNTITYRNAARGGSQKFGEDQTFSSVDMLAVRHAHHNTPPPLRMKTYTCTCSGSWMCTRNTQWFSVERTRRERPSYIEVRVRPTIQVQCLISASFHLLWHGWWSFATVTTITDRIS